MSKSHALRSALFLAGCGLAWSAFAHDAWIEPRDGAYVVLYGHGDKHEGYAPAKVKAVAAADGAGATLPLSLASGKEDARFTVQGQPALVTLHFDNGIWTKTTEGSKNLPKNEVPGALSSSHSIKFGKTILAWTSAATKPQGQQLEILPLSATAPAAGGTLPVQILWEGKPLAGAKLVRSAYSKEKPIEADADGKAAVPVTAGRQMVSVSQKQDLVGNPQADTLSVAANLVFEAR
jgi:nickel transport protein